MQANLLDTRPDNNLDPSRLGIDVKTIDGLYPGMDVGRKRRLKRTLDGTPRKGTLVIVFRGTDDRYDIILDRNFLFQSTRNLGKFSFYQQMATQIRQILTTLLHPNYKQHWDVFATGHSLGGAYADQLVLDGIATGGMTFSSARTADSNTSQPTYSIINRHDKVIGNMVRVNGSAPQYDVVNPNNHPGNTLNHGIPFLAADAELSATDPYPRWAPQIFTGRGRAPNTDTLARLSSNVYNVDGRPYVQTNPAEFEREGLLLDDLTIRRDNRPIVHFYVLQTPQSNYFERPIKSMVTRAISNLLTDPTQKNAQKARMFTNTMLR
jgi:hypothetical protein